MDDSPTKWKPKKLRVKPVPEGGLELDSEEERWAAWMFTELVDAKALIKFERAESIELFPGLVVGTKKLFQEHSYKADFKLTWNTASPIYRALTDIPTKGHPVFFASGGVSIIEVKPCFDAHGKTGLATMNAKWVYQKTGLIIQVLRIGTAENSFFGKAWTPDAFRFTKATGAVRSIRYETVRSLEELINPS